MKVLFRKSDGRLLGAQALGEDDAWTSGSARWPWRSRWARRSTTSRKPSCATRRSSAARRTRSTSRAWSPPTSCVATCRSAHWDAAENGFLLDVREPSELAVESVPGAVNIPLGQLRARLGELPRDREILVICRSGQRAYYATRILLQNGFKAAQSQRRHAVAFDACREVKQSGLPESLAGSRISAPICVVDMPTTVEARLAVEGLENRLEFERLISELSSNSSACLLARSTVRSKTRCAACASLWASILRCSGNGRCMAPDVVTPTHTYPRRGRAAAFRADAPGAIPLVAAADAERAA